MMNAKELDKLQDYLLTLSSGTRSSLFLVVMPSQKQPRGTTKVDAAWLATAWAPWPNVLDLVARDYENEARYHGRDAVLLPRIEETYSLPNFSRRLSELVDSGKVVGITVNGRMVAKLVPIDQAEPDGISAKVPHREPPDEP